MSIKRIGRYEIKNKIGQGGMATVYLGYDPRVRRDVAIKVLPHKFTHDHTFRARFELEAQTIGALEHPAIVPVHDFGEEGGQPYLVMRYMPGGSLAQRLGRGPLPLNEVVRIVDRIASALDRAHQSGIIHRDLKPGNILFDQYDDAFLADFGIAKMAETTAALTGSGLIGTPGYMSPEQVKGEAVDGRSDIYTLGVILFEMLTGQQPYKAQTPIALAFKHVHEPIPDLRKRNANLDPDLQDTINRAMSKAAPKRFQTAQALASSVKSVSQKTGQGPSQQKRSPIPAPIVTEALPNPNKATLFDSEKSSFVPRWVWGVTAVAALIIFGWGVAAWTGSGENRIETAVPTPQPATESSQIIAAASTSTDTPIPTNTTVPTIPPTKTATSIPTETAVPHSAATQSPTATCNPPQAQVALSSVNIRRGPGANYDGIGIAYLEDILPIIAQTSTGGWYNVEFGDATGWVSATVVDLITKEDCAAIPPAATIPPSPTPTFTPTPPPTPTNTPAPPANTRKPTDTDPTPIPP